MSLSDIRAFKQISDRIGTSGQPTAAQFADIAAAGYETVINLVPPEQRLLPEEAEVVSGLGMEYVNIPVVWTAPTRENLLHFFDVMDARQGQRVFVHCAANMRVSAFVYLYRVLRQDEDRDDAEQDLLDLWNPQEIWGAFIDDALSGWRRQEARVRNPCAEISGTINIQNLDPTGDKAMAVSDDVKKKIDDWIKSSGRNQYGDPKDTVYAGGNPLFDERSPSLKDRYEYILQKNPQLKEK